MNKKAMYKLSYGLYLLTAREGERDNGCIVNTAVQVANNPARISVAVIKENLTCDMIVNTGRCCLSVLTQDAPFSLFERFGMQSGRTADKFADMDGVARSESGLCYLTKHANAYLALEVTASYDLGSHMLFICQAAEGEVLSDEPSCTYAYYQSVIKNSAAAPTPKKGWRCTVCGYVYEGENLPPDFVCPLCKHGPEDFEPI